MGTEKRERQKANRQAKLEREAAESEVEKRGTNVRRLLILGAIVAVIAVLYFVFRGDDSTSEASGPVVDAPVSAGDTLEPPWDCPTADSTRATDLIGEAPSCLEAGVDYTATITTNLGTLTVDLDPGAAPTAVNSFYILSNYQYYDGTAIFGSDTGLGSIFGGATHTNDSNEPGPGFPTVADTPPEGGWDFSAGALVFNPNGTFEIVAASAEPGYTDSQATVIGRLSGSSRTIAGAIYDLHVGQIDTLSPTDGGPSESVTVESITVTPV